ncbi:hypothetical protein Tco_1253723 [Tanacetum coccineum]|uniref:Uncharacterized protein n=1 Tax=Tanacetum coccineum TaxID=301880 RepID=A0ABQ4WSA0_9ASTR
MNIIQLKALSTKTWIFELLLLVRTREEDTPRSENVDELRISVRSSVYRNEVSRMRKQMLTESRIAADQQATLLCYIGGHLESSEDAVCVRDTRSLGILRTTCLSSGNWMSSGKHHKTGEFSLVSVRELCSCYPPNL